MSPDDLLDLTVALLIGLIAVTIIITNCWIPWEKSDETLLDGGQSLPPPVQENGRPDAPEERGFQPDAGRHPVVAP